MRTPYQEDPRITNVRIKAWSGTVSNAVKWAGICITVYIIAYYTADAIRDLSGQMTLTDISVDIGFGVPVLFWGVTIIISIIGFMYGLNQWRLRRKTIAHFEAPKRSREDEIDPQRSSSGQPSDGQIPKE